MSLINSNIRLSGLPRQIRPAALAGSFYPADVDELRGLVSSMLDATDSNTNSPKAIIAPHAGYIYSGSTAAKVYASLKNTRNSIKRVVLLGPAHRVFVKGLALPKASVFATPLGNIDIDLQAVKLIKHLPHVHFSDEAHAQEHSIEVHLPFLQSCLNRFSLLPLVVGDATPEQVAKVLTLLWGGDETLIVISSDLSHFHEYERSQQIDTATANAIEKMDIDRINPEQACGCRPMNGLLHIARQKQMQIERVGLCNSGDTAGSRDRVVGYGAWILNEKKILDEKQQGQLLDTARKSIEHGLKKHSPIKINPADFSGILCETRATFVTLKINNQLRGCIGTTEAVQTLVSSIAANAFSAAFRDPRFKPLSAEEYKNIELSISVLTPQLPVSFETESELIAQIIPGTDGLTILKGSKKATFLPAVWESLPKVEDFLAQLKLKAGIKPNEVIEKAWRYSAESFS
jgi:AmmeMemoRadiSam system protein B/AmmeMemoRadiSam system protein A